MEELLNQVIQKTGLSMDQARTAVTAVLGFIRGKLPAPAAGQFDGAIAKLGQNGPLPSNISDINALTEKTGLAAGQVGSLIETVTTFLKNKLPPDLVTSIGSALSKGATGGVAQKVAAMFGRG